MSRQFKKMLRKGLAMERARCRRPYVPEDNTLEFECKIDQTQMRGGPINYLRATTTAPEPETRLIRVYLMRSGGILAFGKS